MVDSIYIHIPFCNRKCSYCDFYILTNMPNMYEKYVEYLIKEIRMYPKIKYDTIYFGGGTPSVLNVEQIKKILDELDYNENTEITLELNPTNMTYEKLKELRKLGVNRLSIGVQSFNDEILKLMNREHNVDDSIKIYNDARKAGFSNISLDLIFAIPSQTIKDLDYDIENIGKLNPEHISIYSLIWEEGSRFSKLLREKKIEKLDEDTEANMFVTVMDKLIKLGYEHYEISSFCKNKKYGRHNMKYWDNSEFIGVGISASSFYNNKRFEKIRKLNEYYKKIDNNEIPINEKTIEEVTKKDLRELEYILGLRRLNIGINYYEDNKEKIDKLISKGLITKKNNRIYLTKEGILLGDNVILELI